MKFFHRNLQAQKYFLHGLVVLSALLLASCSSEPENPANTIYFGGDILTMAGDQPQYVEALAVTDGKISFLGSKVEADKLVGKNTQEVNLLGSALIPAVVTGIQQELTLQGITNEPNCWKNATFNSSQELIDALKIVQEERAKLGLGLFCLGYVPNASDVNGALTDADLDKAFPETSVILVGASLQTLLTNSAAKKKFTLDTYKTLRKAIQKTGQVNVGLQVGQAADFMTIDKNPLKDKSVSLAAVNITGTYVNGMPVLDAPKNLGMLAILDIFSAYAEENSAKEKIEAMNAEAVVKEKQKKEADAKAKAKITAASKSETKPATKKSVTISKGKREIKQVPIEPADAVVEEAPVKPKAVRFNMTQDGKKMTAEDFDAWMKAQGIRIVPAKPATVVAPIVPAAIVDDK
jgi:hypothetical protein